MPDARAKRIAATALATALTVCLLYALDRTRAAISEPPFDPTVVVGTTRIAYFWRLKLSLFVGTLIAPAWWGLFAGREERSLSVLARATLPVAVLCAALAAMWP